MQFKIDENLPFEIKELLENAKHDVKTVNEQHLQGAEDYALINICKNEKRVLITLDTDFSDIRTYPPQEYSGIIVLRVINQAKHHILEIFLRALPIIDRETLDRHLWIIEESRIRIR
jgi:predicted nuclease of predicted toxin-antitoxin system